MHLRSGKVATRTRRTAEIDFLMDGETDFGPHHVHPSIIHQLPECLHLPGGRPRLRESANETDADANFVDLLAMHVAALQLLEPARANLNLTIAGINAIADHEMIRQPVLHPALPMCPAIDGGVPLPDCTVMRHNPLPTIRPNAQPQRDPPNFRSVSIDRRAPGRFGQRLEW